MKCRMLIGLIGVMATLPLAAQRPGQNSTFIHNVPYDGRFTYARIKYETAGATMGFGRFRGNRIMWNHDFQTSDLNFPKILETVSTIHARTDESNVFTFDDPELFRFPVAYICEVGYWAPDAAELAGVQKYLRKGGFLIVDDFGGYDWDNFTVQLQRVLPGARPIRLTIAHPIFNSFFAIKSLEVPENYRGAEELYGVFEDNDPTKRMMMIVNYNFDVSEYWEWSATGTYAVAPTNEAYKFGVNYVMYTLSH